MIHIGTSGWSYDHWVDVLYPRDASSRDRLPLYGRLFDTVELNSSFHRWPRLSACQYWRQRLPGAFGMSLKRPGG
jgi:uncharacterized protein YecE (DUF72 family)